MTEPDLWIRPVVSVIDYDYNAETCEWELPCEDAGEGCLFGDVVTATWMLGRRWPDGRKKTWALCDLHAAQYCRRLKITLPLELRPRRPAPKQPTDKPKE